MPLQGNRVNSRRARNAASSGKPAVMAARLFSCRSSSISAAWPGTCRPVRRARPSQQPYLSQRPYLFSRNAPCRIASCPFLLPYRAIRSCCPRRGAARYQPKASTKRLMDRQHRSHHPIPSQTHDSGNNRTKKEQTKLFTCITICYTPPFKYCINLLKKFTFSHEKHPSTH